MLLEDGFLFIRPLYRNITFSYGSFNMALSSNPDKGVPSNRSPHPPIASSDRCSDCCSDRKQVDTSIIRLWNSYKHDPRGTLVGEEKFFLLGETMIHYEHILRLDYYPSVKFV